MGFEKPQMDFENSGLAGDLPDETGHALSLREPHFRFRNPGKNTHFHHGRIIQIGGHKIIKTH
jgi:hypothetical protein